MYVEMMLCTGNPKYLEKHIFSTCLPLVFQKLRKNYVGFILSLGVRFNKQTSSVLRLLLMA
jgi:hypothetical protein